LSLSTLICSGDFNLKARTTVIELNAMPVINSVVNPHEPAINPLKYENNVEGRIITLLSAK